MYEFKDICFKLSDRACFMKLFLEFSAQTTERKFITRRASEMNQFKITLNTNSNE